MKTFKQMSEDVYSSDYKYNPRTGRKTKAKRIAFNYGSDDKKVEKNDKKVEEKMDLSKADMGDVIKDFKSSDAPQFKGKSDKKKREMAIAAKLEADRGVKEQAPVAPVPDKKYIKGTPEHKAYKATKKPINGMPTNEEADKKKEDDLPFTPDKPKNPSAKAGKFGIGPSTAKHLAKMGMQLAMKKKAMKEEKDEQEYGYEGAMAITQLKTMIRHADHMMGMMEEDTDLPEWVQSKITLATDYVQTAHDYLMSEMNEELSPKQKKIDKNNNGKIDGQDLAKIRNEEDRLAKEDFEQIEERNKENALKRKTMDASRGARFKAQGNNTPDPEPEHKTAQAHNKAVGRAIRQMSNEEIEDNEVKISYRDFIKEYESKDGKYVHKGSYGSSYKEPEEDDEPSAKKPSAKKAGRPAGAKSGALQKRQPIKFK
jgi:hypothetical protein